MSRSDYRKLVFGGLIAALAAWYAVPRWLGHSGPTSAAAAATELDEPVADEELPGADEYAEAQTVLAGRRAAATVAWPANPFEQMAERPAEVVAPAAESADAAQTTHVLKGVLTGTRPRALLDDSVVGVGDVLADGSTVVSIAADSLTLQGPQAQQVFVKLAE